MTATCPQSLFGFNLLSAFLPPGDERFPHMHPGYDGRTDEDLLDFMVEFGFNYVRLPMSFAAITVDGDVTQLNEAVMQNVDATLQACANRGIHCSLNFHEVPGYGIIEGSRPWPHMLFVDDFANQQFADLWGALAQRYAGIPSADLSFNLLNEPPDFSGRKVREWLVPITKAQHEQTMRQAIAAIHAHDPQRLMMLDGRDVANFPLPELEDTGAWQCCRGYGPGEITHYQAEWAPDIPEVKQQWPTELNGEQWNLDKMFDCYKHWVDPIARGVQVICGEFGCHNRTPHAVCLAWMNDLLVALRETGISWAMWNLRGSFGILDSGRDDVAYESWRGYKLDRKMLELLLQHKALYAS